MNRVRAFHREAIEIVKKRTPIGVLFSLNITYYKLIATIAPNAIIIPTTHLNVIFSLKNIDAIIADNMIDAPEVNGYKTTADIYLAAAVLKYE